MRLNKYLGESGSWSRRQADDVIAAGRVTVNGVVAVLGAQVAEGDVIKVDGDAVGHARKLDKPVYIALNKPIGVISTTERAVEGNIIDFVDHPERIFPIGRLDKESEGLILLTNDGDIVNEVLRSEHNHEKEYVVTVDRALDDEFASRMAAGIRLQPEGMTKRCKVAVLGPKTFSIILTQGLNRQIRRMCEALGYEVVALQRIRFMNILLGNQAVGRWRNLTPQELDGLRPPAKSEARSSPGRGNGGRPKAGRPAGGGGRPTPGSGGRPNSGGAGGRPNAGGGSRPTGGGGRATTSAGGRPSTPGAGGRPNSGGGFSGGGGRPTSGSGFGGRPSTPGAGGRPNSGGGFGGRPSTPGGRPNSGGAVTGGGGRSNSGGFGGRPSTPGAGGRPNSGGGFAGRPSSGRPSGGRPGGGGRPSGGRRGGR
ncbi:MAG: pseudouridine synthase [Kofleriaceae bacterium]